MASVRVAVRVRPLDERENGVSSKVIVEMKGGSTTIYKPIGLSSRGEEPKTFYFDLSYDSTDPHSSSFASQEKIYKDLGSDVIKAAFEGFNACVFAYGQTGSGKSYTMMGFKLGKSHPANEASCSLPGDLYKEDKGLIPRICEGLFQQIAEKSKNAVSFHTEVSFLEIYNEGVQDLLQKSSTATDRNRLKVREHPKEGPYVQNLTRHLVRSYSDIDELLLLGNSNRTTASTDLNDTSSRSHAIFTIRFTRAWLEDTLPCETVSKIHLVDLAGSERADASRSTGIRLKEAANINKSLVTLGCVISTLVLFQNIVTTKRKKQIFIPYRDSVLTWLLKDSLGGNSKTTMIATVSPAEGNYAETMSTLHYASRAKNIVNSPKVNQDKSVKVIRGLQAEMARLRKLLEEANQVTKGEALSCVKVEEKLHVKEAKVAALTKEWTIKWKESHNILKEETVALRKRRSGVILDCQFPHLIGIDEDLLGAGIILYYLKEGQTAVGSNEGLCGRDIVLQRAGILNEHCELLNQNGVVTLIPHVGALCLVNGSVVTSPCRLTQGSILQLGKGTMFRFNHPTEVEILKEKRQSGLLSPVSLSPTDTSKSAESLSKVMLQGPGCANVMSVETGNGKEKPVSKATHVKTSVPHSLDGAAHQGGVHIRGRRELEWDPCHKSGAELTSKGLQRSAGELRSGDGSLQQTSVPGRGDGCGSGPVGSANEIQGVCAHRNKGRRGSDGISLSAVSHLQSTGGGEAAPDPQRASTLNSCPQFDKTAICSPAIGCPTTTRELSFYREMDVDKWPYRVQTVGLESLVNTVSWIVQGASQRILSSSLMLQQVLEQRLHPVSFGWPCHVVALVRNSKVLSVVKDCNVISLVKDGYFTSLFSEMKILSLVKKLPLVQHFHFEMMQHLQAMSAGNIHVAPQNCASLGCTPPEEQSRFTSENGENALGNGMPQDDDQTEVKLKLILQHGYERADEQTRRVSTVWFKDASIYFQALITFPDTLLKLQLSCSTLRAALQNIIPRSLFTSQMVVALFWLDVAKRSDPKAQPALVILMEDSMYIVTERSGALEVFYELPLVQLKEVYFGFAGHSLCLVGPTEDGVLGLYTYSQSLSRELCRALLGLLCPTKSWVSQIPLLHKDMMEMSLKRQAPVPDVLLDRGLRVSCSFQRGLADLLCLLQSKITPVQRSLGEVQLQLYCCVGICFPSNLRLVGQLFVTDAHLGLVQEQVVFSAVCSVARELSRLQFRSLTVRRLCDVRGVVVREEDSRGAVAVDVILANVKARGHPESGIGCAHPSSHAQVWKLTFSCSAEAARLINHLSSI